MYIEYVSGKMNESSKMRISKSSIIIIGALSLTGYLNADQSGPAIYIKHKIDNVSVRKMLKFKWQLCADEKKMFKAAKDSNVITYPIMEQALKDDRPEYDIDADLDTPTNWKIYGIESEHEYFLNDKYASYKEFTAYSLSEDGRCSIISKTKKSAVIDDGKFRYLLNFPKKQAVKFRSGVVIFQENNKRLRSQKNEAALLAITEKLSVVDTTLPASSGSETVVGNYRCDYKSVSSQTRSKICYWDRLNYYPSVMNRPVILRSITFIGDDKNSKQAEIFEVNKNIDTSKFVPNPEFRIVDRSNY